jgi:hypothetical protein
VPGSDDVMVRFVSFFADDDQLAAVERRIKDDVIPRFSVFPEFLGFVALRSVGRRSEIVAMSFWEGGLEGSEAISENFRDEIERVTGTMPSRREYGVIASMWRRRR